MNTTNIKKTNWDKYYNKPYKSASITRRITENLLINIIKKYGVKNDIEIVELGGANSCFYDGMNKSLNIKKYSVVDNNQIGLDMLQGRTNSNNISLHNIDILNNEMGSIGKFDIVYSVGLIEHFNKKDTETITRKHFDLVKDGGLVIITFPTPTFLYRITRKIAEILRIWIFHDERPLEFVEVMSVCGQYGEVIYKKINWYIILTQGIVVIRKK